MNLKSQALDLLNFLDPFAEMWNAEIMNDYPETIKHYPHEWLTQLASLSDEDVYALDCKIIPESMKHSSLKTMIEKTESLSLLPFISSSPEIALEDWAFNGIKKKKKHEIQKIVPVIKELNHLHLFNCVIDIGGGVGHLSRILAHYHSIPSISIDRDLNFQKIGLSRLKKYRKLDNARDVEFINLDFGSTSDREIISKVFLPKSFTIGLHTCGPLANTVIHETVTNQTAGLLSFGCCYHSMNPKTDFPLSDFYKKNCTIFEISNFALTLATRAHTPMNYSDYQTKKQVKNYRYALHLFLIKYFNQKNFIEVGECNTRIYWEDFSNYIRLKLSELKIQHQFTDEDFNNFYNDPFIKNELKTMWLCNIVRWQFGRVLEVYLLIDRALYLEEQGYSVKIEQYFDESLSPRNIGILATLAT